MPGAARPKPTIAGHGGLLVNIRSSLQPVVRVNSGRKHQHFAGFPRSGNRAQSVRDAGPPASTCAQLPLLRQVISFMASRQQPWAPGPVQRRPIGSKAQPRILAFRSNPTALKTLTATPQRRCRGRVERRSADSWPPGKARAARTSGRVRVNPPSIRLPDAPGHMTQCNRAAHVTGDDRAASRCQADPSVPPNALRHDRPRPIGSVAREGSVSGST